MKKIRVGIINVTGYAGSELARILHLHPNVDLVSVTGRSALGQKLSSIFPHLAEIDLQITDELKDVHLAFSAMPHKASAEALLPLIKNSVRVIDISADFRLRNPKDYTEWYQFKHPAPKLLQGAVFGLPELYRAKIKKAQIIANPGCYPTSAILALAPAVSQGLIGPDIIIDSKSGISGAGRTLALSSHFAEATENVLAYALEGHRHLPEIVQEIKLLKRGYHPAITFIPHLIPMSRGILSTCYANLKKDTAALSIVELKEIYQSYYAGEPFTRVTQSPPGTKHTMGSNMCLLYPSIDRRTNRLVIVSCLDNLIKGAAGQAVQNMNIMFGFEESLGLEALPLYP